MLQKMKSKRIIKPQRKPELTSFPHPKEAPCWTGQERGGEDSKATGSGVKVSRREGRRKRPRSHATWSGEQAREPGLCDGSAGGGQGQMLMESSPEMQPPPAQSSHLFLEGQ